MLRIGVIGLGGISNRHIRELLETGECKITAVCDINDAAIEEKKQKYGLTDVLTFNDYRELIDCSEVDAVEICTPNYLHIPMAEYAAMRGKPINVEKPLALKTEDTAALEKIIKEKNLPNMMSFTYRSFPAVRYAKHILDKGLIGKIISVNAQYFKSSGLWKDRRLEWRFVKEYAGTGVLGDLAVHIIDAVQLLIGDFKKVSAMTGIVVKQRLKLDSNELGNVETDDYCNFIAEVEDRKNGERIPASFAITRCALGHANTIIFDIFGTNGVISFNLNDPDILNIFIDEPDKTETSLQTIEVPDEFKMSQGQMFVNLLKGKEPALLPTIDDGIKCQKILDAILEASESGNSVSID